MSTDCQICCLPFTSMVRKEISCPFCQYVACTDCIKKYILSSLSEADCMNCRVPLSTEFIDSITSRLFRNGEYKRHRENVLLEKEKSLLPATIPYVEEKLRKRELRKENELLYKEREEVLKQVAEIERKINQNNYNLYVNNQEDEDSIVKNNKKTFIKACVMPECRGFLSSDWICAVCKTSVCSDCHEEKKEEHTCDPNNVETAKLLAKDTKPCPQCYSLIYRISGCDLMFCTVCNVSFSWKSGKEVNPLNNHNPHYIEYIRKTNGYVPRAPGDIPMTCGGFPHFLMIDNHIKEYKNNYRDNIDKRIDNIYNAQRVFNEILEYQIERNNIPNTLKLYRDFRVRYLMNELSEEDWKTNLFKSERIKEIQKSKKEVYEMLITAATDLINKLIMQHLHEEITETLDEIQVLLDYFNESFKSVIKRFGLKSNWAFNDKWELIKI